jgi:hypothetical protein
VDLQDQSPLEVANHVAVTVKQHARPWRAIITLVLAIGAGAVAHAASRGLSNVIGHGHVTARIIWASSTVACCFFVLAAVFELAGKVRQFLTPRAGTGHAAVVRYSIILIGAIITFVTALALLKIPVTQLLVGGAVTTIFLGIAAQQSLGNVFAGIVLLFSRPFAVGDSVLMRSGGLGGQIQGVVIEIGLTYVRLDTGDGVMYLPNSQVLAAGVGHIRPATPEPPTLDPSASPSSSSPAVNCQPADGPFATRPPGDNQPSTSPSGGGGTADGQPAAVPSGGTAPGSTGAPSGDAPGSGGRPLSPPGL